MSTLLRSVRSEGVAVPFAWKQPQLGAGENAHSCYKRVDFTQERRSIQAIRLPVGRLTASVALAAYSLLFVPYTDYRLTHTSVPSLRIK